MRSYAAALTALALAAHDAAAFKLPVSSRAIHTTGRRAAVVRYATAEELLAQAAALREEVEQGEKDLGIGAYAPKVSVTKEPELPPLSPEEIQQKLLSVAIEAKSKDAEEQVATLDSLKESGDLRLWGVSQAPTFKATNIGQLQREYGLDAITLGLAAEDSLDELKAALFAVTAFSSIMAILSGVVVGGNAGATLTYLFAVLPIIFLGVGSTAPGLISAVIEVGKTRLDPKYGERRVKHEAAHFLMGYLCGVPIQGYEVEGALPEVTLYDTRKGALSRSPMDMRLTRDEANGLSVVAMAGAVAEVNAMGDAKGGQQDLELLNKILQRVDPPMSPDAMQQQTRWAAAEASRLLKTHDAAYQSLVSALEQKCTVAECIARLETAKKA